MELSPHSKNHLLSTFAKWEVPKDYAWPIYNYLVHGFHPGSFFRAMLANDYLGAIRSSHPANTVVALKSLAGWIDEKLRESTTFGSYECVDAWLQATPEERREELQRLDLIFSQKVELVKILTDERTVEPFLWRFDNKTEW